MAETRNAVVDNHGFRYYDPELGRYLTRDPAGYVDGPNVYLYVGNNPINFIDPEGLVTIDGSKGEDEIRRQIAEDQAKDYDRDPKTKSDINAAMKRDPRGLAYLEDPHFYRMAGKALSWTADNWNEAGFYINQDGSVDSALMKKENPRKQADWDFYNQKVAEKKSSREYQRREKAVEDAKARGASPGVITALERIRDGLLHKYQAVVTRQTSARINYGLRSLRNVLSWGSSGIFHTHPPLFNDVPSGDPGDQAGVRNMRSANNNAHVYGTLATPNIERESGLTIYGAPGETASKVDITIKY